MLDNKAPGPDGIGAEVLKREVRPLFLFRIPSCGDSAGNTGYSGELRKSHLSRVSPYGEHSVLTVVVVLYRFNVPP